MGRYGTGFFNQYLSFNLKFDSLANKIIDEVLQLYDRKTIKYFLKKGMEGNVKVTDVQKFVSIPCFKIYIKAVLILFWMFRLHIVVKVLTVLVEAIVGNKS